MDSLIQKIILPVDFSPASERAARFGCTLARSLGAHVYLIHVVDAATSKGPMADVSGSDRHRYLEARTAIADLAARIGRGAQVTTEVRIGPVDAGITSAVIAYGADLVVMSTHGRTGLPHLLFGSVAEQVIRTALCPVLVMCESGKVRMHRAAVESSETTQAAQPA